LGRVCMHKNGGRGGRQRRQGVDKAVSGAGLACCRGTPVATAATTAAAEAFEQTFENDQPLFSEKRRRLAGGNDFFHLHRLAGGIEPDRVVAEVTLSVEALPQGPQLLAG